MKLRLLTLAGFLIATVIVFLPANSAAEPQTTIADLIVAADGFAPGSGDGYLVGIGGLTLAAETNAAVYISPELEASIPFNAVVPQWIADVPATTEIHIMLRTAEVPDVWSEWYDIEMQPDWMLPGEVDIVGEMITVPVVDLRHNYVQFLVRLSRQAGSLSPVVRQLRLTFIDSTDGPTVEQMVGQQSALDAARAATPGLSAVATGGSHPRPRVISREVWCTDPACDYSNGLYYEPATHLIVHHTVSANENSDWAAVVRAIWRFHTYTRGWGDIGYNYLVDMDGIIYEGHNSQDFLNLDVIGTHAADANAGGFGVALIGTFTTPEEYPVSARPPQPMLESTADLLAWKADQRDIDVYDASRMVNMRWGLPHLMGHRDVYGGTATTCPGGQAHALLPWLRDRVAELIGYQSPYIYVDELDDAFTMSDINQYWWAGPRGCGYNGHAYYTWSVMAAADSTNWGEWRPNVPESGRYEIEVYAPYCDTGEPETVGAAYEVTHANGMDRVVVSHNNNIGLWMSLGEFELFSGGGTRLRLTDLTSTDSGQGVWFDAIRLRQLPPTASNLAPAANSWLNQRQVTFSWQVSSLNAIHSTTLQVATDEGFANILFEKTWATGGTTSYQHTFDHDFAILYWRVLLTLTPPGQGSMEQIATKATSFGLDSLAPASAVTKLLAFPNAAAYMVEWDGLDQLSANITYNVDYRLDGDYNWVRWLTGTTKNSDLFVSPDSKQEYWFRTQGTDSAGNVEPANEVGDRNTRESILLAYAIMLPVVSR